MFTLGSRARSARVRFLLGANVNAPFYQVSTPEFRLDVRSQIQGRGEALYSGTEVVNDSLCARVWIFCPVFRH